MITQHTMRRMLRKYRMEFNELVRIVKDNPRVSPALIQEQTGWSMSKCMDVFTSAQLCGLLEDPRSSYLSPHEQEEDASLPGGRGEQEASDPGGVRGPQKLGEGQEEAGEHERLGGSQVGGGTGEVTPSEP